MFVIPVAVDFGEMVLDALDFLATYGVGLLLGIPILIGVIYGLWWVSTWVLIAVFEIHDRVRPNRPASGRLAQWVRN